MSRQEFRSLPNDVFSAEWMAAYAWNWRNGHKEPGHWKKLGFIRYSSGSDRKEELLLPTDVINSAQTYEDLLMHIETELAILNVKASA